MTSFCEVATRCFFLLICGRALVILAQSATSGCSKTCTDYSKLCPSFRDSSFYANFNSKRMAGELGKLAGHHMPPTPDCKNLYYQILCPLSCNQCTSCDVSGDVTTLDSTSQENAAGLKVLLADLENEKAATAELERKLTKCSDYVDSQETSPEVDAENFRLVFRHTSNQLLPGELETLFRFGTVSGVAQKNIGKDQFRDPDLHFFWHDTTEVRLDMFDKNGQKDGVIYIQMPQRSHSNYAQTTWPSIFGITKSNCELVRNSGKNDHYRTIYQKCTKSGYYDNKRRPRMWFGEDDSCKRMWFFVQSGTSAYVCSDLEQKLRGSAALNNGYTVSYYQGFNDIVYNDIGLKMASKFELRITGSFASSSTNGYSKVFRYPSFAGVDVMDYFESGTIDPTKDRSQLTANQVKTEDMFRSADLYDRLKAASLVLFVIYDQQGAVVEAMTFKGTGNEKSWFGFDNLVSNVNWKIYGGFNFFNIDGDSGNGRRFYIHETYNGCENDPGYLLVACNRPNGDPPCTNYESMGDNSGDPKNYICKIIHTISQERSHSKTYAVASAFEIFTK